MIVDYVSGACLMIRRVVFDMVGGFDERFFMYSEEEDFCHRALQSGFRTAYVPSARAMHISGASFGANVRWRSALVASSRLKYYEKYHSPIEALAFRAILLPALAVRVCFGVLASIFHPARSSARIYIIDALVTMRTYLFRTVESPLR